MKKCLKIILALAVGIIIGLLLPHLFGKGVDTGWIKLTTEKKHFGISYATEAIFNDLPMPDIKSVEGKGKFINAVGPRGATEFGYIIDLTMDKLDLSKVPEQYKKPEKTTINGVETHSEPIEDAYYTVEFEFQFKDKDGFVLQTMKSIEEDLVSGKANTFQGKLKDAISYDVASKTDHIELHPSIVKCLSCKSK